MSATLKLTHKSIGVEVRRGAYDVVVDGRGLGISADERHDRDSDRTGTSDAAGRSGRKSSRTETFDAVENQIVAFRCTGKSLLPIFLASLFVPSLALQLVRD